jgi:hypothetical protein
MQLRVLFAPSNATRNQHSLSLKISIFQSYISPDQIEWLSICKRILFAYIVLIEKFFNLLSIASHKWGFIFAQALFAPALWARLKPCHDTLPGLFTRETTTAIEDHLEAKSMLFGETRT